MPAWDADDPLAVWSTAPPGQSMTRGRHGIVASLANIRRALGTPGWWRRIGWDTFRSEVMWCGWPDGPLAWRSWSDHDSVEARIMLERAGFEPVGKDMLRDALMVAARDCTFDAAQTWLGALAWDGQSRVETFLSDWASVPDRPYARAVSRYLWTALAGRVVQPSEKADAVPILVGSGGVGKTTLVESLAPGDDFAGRINLAHKDADLARALRGKLVVELAELRGLRGRESEATKAFVDARSDEWVPKWQEYARKAPRRFLMIGTTDKPQFLADTAGNERRWLPVAVGACTPLREDERAQLWAEALVLWAAEGVAWREAGALARLEQGDYVADDVVQQALEAWVDTPFVGSGNDEADASYPQIVNGHAMTWGDRGFTLNEALTWGLGISRGAVGKSQEAAAGDALNKMGFSRRRDKRRGPLRDKFIWRRWGENE